jgi:hypothetical protein
MNLSASAVPADQAITLSPWGMTVQPSAWLARIVLSTDCAASAEL